MPINRVGGGVAAGAVEYFAGSAAPAGWLACNGAAVSRTAYAALFLAIGTTYGVGDGSTTFNLPELRGEFLRGLDSGRGVDAARVLGSAQAASRILTRGTGNVETGNGGSDAVDGADSVTGTTAPAKNAGDVSVAHSWHAIRPRNIAMLPCIKF